MNKKLFTMVTMLCCLAGWSAAELVDDFEGWQTGPVSTVVTDGSWVTDPTDPDAVIEADPADANNKVMSTVEAGGTGGGGQTGTYAVLDETTSIADGETKTLYLRFRVNTLTTDQAIGLSSLDEPTLHGAGDWNQFHACFRFTNGFIDIRDGGSWLTTLTNRQLTVDTWYHLWFVVFNEPGATSDSVRMYMNTSGADATEADRMVTTDAKDTFAFRVQQAATLDRLYWRAQDGAEPTDKVFIDDVHISPGIDLSIPASLKPYNPSVEQTADIANDDIDVVLKWNAALDPAGVYAVNPDIVDQYVFMSIGDDPNLYYRGATGVDPLEVPESQFGPLNLAPGLEHRWVVVEAMDGYAQSLTPFVSQIDVVDANNIVGPLWTFTTTQLVPVFVEQPADQWVFPGETATFTVALKDENGGVNYQWYKDDVAISGATSATLTIEDAQLADEGSYFCQATNAADDSSDSEAAILRIKRLTSYYPLETDVLDAVSGFDMTLSQEAASAGMPALTAGSVDPSVGAYSLQLDNADHATDPNGQYAQLPVGVVDYPDLTITAWVYWNGGANWQRLLDFGNDTTQYMFLTPSNGGECRFVLNSGSGEQIVSTDPLPSGQWVFVAAVLDGDTGRLYVNGEQRAENTGMTINPVDFAPTLNYIGKSQYEADAEFDGMVDALKIYNYALDPMTIAGEFYDITGTDPCVTPDFAGSAYNFDNEGTSRCRVDLADFALFLEAWLTDGFFTE